MLMFLEHLGGGLRAHQTLKVSLASNATLSYPHTKLDIINIQNMGFIELDERIRMPPVRRWGDNYVERYPSAKSWSHTNFPALWRRSSLAPGNIATFQYITTALQLINAYDPRFVRTSIIPRFLFSIISKLDSSKLCYNCYTRRLNSESFAGALLYLKFCAKAPV